MGKKKKPVGASTIASNRKAFHNYSVEERIVAGLVLTGSEVKSLRQKEASLAEAFVRISDKGEAFLYGLYINPYKQAGYAQHDPTRVRKLLLNKAEIEKLQAKVQQKGLTLIPLKLFFKKAWVKVDLGLCKGKQLHDKRADTAKRDQDRQTQRMVKNQF